MKAINHKSKIQSPPIWIKFVKSIFDFVRSFFALTFLFFQQSFLNFICFCTYLFTRFLSKSSNFKYFNVKSLEYSNGLKFRANILEVLSWYRLTRLYSTININLINQKNMLSESITIFMFFWKNVNVVFFHKPIIHMTNL